MLRRGLTGLLTALTLVGAAVPAAAVAAEQGGSTQGASEQAASTALDADGLPTESLRGAYFVTQQYRDLLGREPDATGLAFWTSRLDTDLSPASMVGAFVDSPEFGQVRQPSARLYLATLGRFPDEAGWSYWSEQLAAGTPLERLAAWFIETPEGQQRVGRDDPDRLVEALYQNVLGRLPDAAGREYWTAQLASGLTRARVVLAFSESAEFRASVDDEILATLLYRGVLGRAPEAAGLAYWTAALAGGASYASIVGGFVESSEYEQRLTRLWCRVIPDADLDFTDGPDPDPDLELTYGEDGDPIVDAAYRRMEANGNVILEAFDYTASDVVLVPSLDRWPDRQFVLSMYTPAIAEHCLSILALAPYPEQVSFHEAPYRRSELDAAFVDIRARLEAEHPQAWWSKGGSTRLDLNLSGTALPVADSILDDYRPMIDEFWVGAFEYPMPSPLPPTACREEPASAVDPATLGLTITTDLAPTTVRAGATPTGTFTVTNNGSRTFTLWWGYEVTGMLGTGSTSSSVFVGARQAPLTVAVIGPGESATGRLDIGTESCDPAVGHRLPNGTYPVWGMISIIEGDDRDAGPNQPGFSVRLPAVPITLTD